MQQMKYDLLTVEWGRVFGGVERLRRQEQDVGAGFYRRKQRERSLLAPES